MKFKAVMMDFDGTVTAKGSVVPSKKMIKKLIELARKMPIAFCTGRQLESLEKRGLNMIIEQIPVKERADILSNIFLMGENGSMGYYFDKKLGKYKEFYRAKWPDELITKAKLKKILAPRIEKFGEIINLHRVVVVMRAHHIDGITPIEEVYAESAEMLKICEEFFGQYKNYEKYMHIGDSGIGVILCPAKGDKDNGTKEFARFLSAKRGMKFSKNLKDILVIGDSAKKGGNDYYFLQGKYGTPFTVGYYDKKLKYPQPVLNNQGKRLLHATGTLSLLEHSF
jgi:hydroxymethylpyrimidine pyrophosphatase-like HAD family hydrolase